MTRYVLHQWFRYEYSDAVRHLDHRLVVVPPAVHGHQRRVTHRLEVDGAAARTESRRDRFANTVLRVRAPLVERSIEFEVRVETEVGEAPAPAVLPVAALSRPWYTAPSPLTHPDDAIRAAARGLAGGASSPLDLAERITSWVHAAFRYQYGVTGVRTTAAQALAGGVGVCQDYAHVMLAVARAAGLAARYVSGHMVGEGGTHAWVEVVLADPRHSRRALAVAFDPTHDRRAGTTYLTVATGRDYYDVAPTSGTYQSDAVGRLSCRKRLEIAELAA